MGRSREKGPIRSYAKFKKAAIYAFLPSIAAVYWPLSSLGADSTSYKYLTRSVKSIFVAESHHVGQSLSDITIKSSGFEHDLSETIRDSDPIENVYVADLDNNGFDEIYIITVSTGSGSYGGVTGFASFPC